MIFCFIFRYDKKKLEQRKENLMLSKEEKYVMTRMAGNLYFEIQSIKDRFGNNSIIGKEILEAELLIKWCLNNENIKQVNNRMRDLLTQGRNGADIAQPLDDVYLEKRDYLAIKESTEARLQMLYAKDAKDLNIENNDKMEKFVLLRMSALLLLIPAKTNQESMALISWYANSEKLKSVNRELSFLYKIMKTKGKQETELKYKQKLKEKSNVEKAKMQDALEITNLAMSFGIKPEKIPMNYNKTYQKKKKKIC